MPKHEFTQFIQLPELKVLSFSKPSKLTWVFELEKKFLYEVCPKCATKSYSVHDHRWVTITDAPVRHKKVILKIRKRRFRCPGCKSVFTEPVSGIRKGFRSTERLRKHVMWASDNFSNLKAVSKQLFVSTWFVYKCYYEQLALQVKKMNNPWGSTVGIDEHAVKKDKRKRQRDFATIFVEYTYNRVREISFGRSKSELMADCRLTSIPGRENVSNVIIDLSRPYHSFVREFFPNAKIIADRFHVVRLFNNILNKYRKEATGDIRKNPIRKLLLAKAKNLESYQRKVIKIWLKENPLVERIYYFKEKLHRFYDIKGTGRARKALIKLTDEMARSTIPEIRSLRQTLHKWREEILNFFFCNRLTNGKTEGYNRKSKLIQRNAYGFKNMDNYRLRLRYACR